MSTIINIVAPLFITFCPVFGRLRTPSARPSLLIFHTDRPMARISSSLVLYWNPRSGSFTLAKRSWPRGPRRKRRHLMVQKHIILHDNARSHTSAAVMDFLRRWLWENLEHPPSSHDMSACDYDLSPKMKEPLRGTRYKTRDELIRDIGWSIRNINKDGRADGVRCFPNIWQRL